MGVLQLIYLCMWMMDFLLDPHRRCDWKLQENGDQCVNGLGSNMPLENSKEHHNIQ